MISEEAALPENASIVVMVLDESLSVKAAQGNQNPMYDERQAHRAAFEEFFAAMAEIGDEPLDNALTLPYSSQPNARFSLHPRVRAVRLFSID